MAAELSCESTYSYTYTYTLPSPGPYAGTGNTEQEAKQAAAGQVPVDTSTTAQDRARDDAKDKWTCARTCQRNIATGEASYPATVTQTGAKFTATISSALVPVTVTCKKATVTSMASSLALAGDWPVAIADVVSELRGLLVRREAATFSENAPGGPEGA